MLDEASEFANAADVLLVQTRFAWFDTQAHPQTVNGHVGHGTPLLIAFRASARNQGRAGTIQAWNIGD